jgi:hypothetical protein
LPLTDGIEPVQGKRDRPRQRVHRLLADPAMTTAVPQATLEPQC